MKILMITPSYRPIIGGTETAVKELTVKLNGIGVRTDVMTFNMNKKWYPICNQEVIEEDGFIVFRVAAFNLFIKSTLNPLDYLFKVNVIPKPNFIKILEDYDIIHFHDDVDLSFPLFSSFIKKPKILHCHTLKGTYRHYERIFLARKLLGKIADFYLCTCYSEYGLLLSLGIPKSRMAILPNGVDTEVFVPRESEKLDDTILFVGRVVRNKGLHILLRSLLCLKLPTHLVIIGPANDAAYSEEVHDMIRKIESNALHKITFLGLACRNVLINWYQKASVYVCPSIYEPFGITNLEALACGTPVVGSNVGGIPEIVKDGVNGILVPPNDPKMFANALEILLKDKELRKKYGKAGRKNVEERFSWNCVTKQLTEIYENVYQAFWRARSHHFMK